MDRWRINSRSTARRAGGFRRSKKGACSATAEFSARLLHAEAGFARLSVTVEALRVAAPGLAPLPLRDGPNAAPAGFASLIVADFAALFTEFGGKRFSLLWRGSRDGSRAPFTLALIRDKTGAIFRGFTPVEWECGNGSNCWKADPSQKSFCFTLKNPHNFPGTKFALNAAKKGRAIGCGSVWGPCFSVIAVSDNCNENHDRWAFFDGESDAYANGTGLDGSKYSTTKEVEVFKTTD
jgi:hypothetical protein